MRSSFLDRTIQFFLTFFTPTIDKEPIYLEGPPQHKDKSKFITQIIAIIE